MIEDDDRDEQDEQDEQDELAAHLVDDGTISGSSDEECWCEWPAEYACSFCHAPVCGFHCDREVDTGVVWCDECIGRQMAAKYRAQEQKGGGDGQR